MFSIKPYAVALLLVVYVTYAYSEEIHGEQEEDNYLSRIILLENEFAEFKKDVMAKGLEQSEKITVQEKMLDMQYTQNANLRHALTEQAVKISVQEKRLADLYDKIANQDTTINNQNTAIAILRVGMDLSEKLDHLSDRVSIMENHEEWENGTREGRQDKSEKFSDFKKDVMAKELEQSTKITAQEEKLSMQDTKMANLRHMLAEQAVKISVQEVRIADLHAKSAHQDTVIAYLRAAMDLSEKLDHLSDRVTIIEKHEERNNGTREATQDKSENKFVKFKREVMAKELEQSTKITDQEEKLRMQDTKLANLRHMLAEQAVNISVQDERIADLHAKNADQDTVIANLRANMNLSEKLDHLSDRVTIIETYKATQDKSEPHGAVFTRWGHDRCPEFQTRMVYSGYTGGAHYTHSGGAADYLCLTKNPEPYTGREKYTEAFGYLFGGEYEFGLSNSKNDHDAPCAVCQSVSYTNFLMLPGSDICPNGWHCEYKGLLMSGANHHKAASQHICVDYATKALHGGRANQDGKLFYPVKTNCGSLRCPPYKNNQFVTCVVCTR